MAKSSDYMTYRGEITGVHATVSSGMIIDVYVYGYGSVSVSALNAGCIPVSKSLMVIGRKCIVKIHETYAEITRLGGIKEGVECARV